MGPCTQDEQDTKEIQSIATASSDDTQSDSTEAKECNRFKTRNRGSYSGMA